MKSLQILHLFIGLAAAGSADLLFFTDQCGLPRQSDTTTTTTKREFKGLTVNNDGSCVPAPFTFYGLEVIRADDDVTGGHSFLQFHRVGDCSGEYDQIIDIEVDNASCLYDGTGLEFVAVRIVQAPA